MIFYCLLAMLPATSCNTEGKDTVEKADSINNATREGAANNNTIWSDESSSDFLTRAANAGMTEIQLAEFAQQYGTIEEVKKFAAMLHADHTDLNAKINALANNRNITLPVRITEEKQEEVDELKKTTDKNLDKKFINEIIDNHDQSIKLFENALRDAKDAEVKTVANDALPKLRLHKDSAKALQKKYW